MQSAKPTESLPPHPFLGFYHCPSCEQQLEEVLRAEARRARGHSQSAQRRLRKRVYDQLCELPASPIAEPPVEEKEIVTRATLDRGEISIPSARRLWTAVLTLAICDLAAERLRAPAERWVASLDARAGSFIWVCGQLDLDHAAVRERLLRLRPSQIRRRFKQLNTDHRPGPGPDLVTRRRLVMRPPGSTATAEETSEHMVRLTSTNSRGEKTWRVLR